MNPPTGQVTVLTADKAVLGPRIPAAQQLLLYSENHWEEFVQEWVHYCLKKKYVDVQRFSGTGDHGIDVAGFEDKDKLNGAWDNYQCKHYDHALRPGDALPEIGKMLWYSFNGEFKAPKGYYFVAPKGIGTALNNLLSNAPKLRQQLIANWDKACRAKIIAGEVLLEGAFLEYVANFDFTVFGSKNSVSLIEDHKTCPQHVARFGGGLPDRPPTPAPPSEISASESRYVQNLLDAYTEHTSVSVSEIAALKPWPKLKDHFSRQRVAFYHAESLRVFARETVPQGTFESFQDDIYAGVINVRDADHTDGYARVLAVTKAARDLQLNSNALIARERPLDRDGICHQLSNDDRLQWKSK